MAQGGQPMEWVAAHVKAWRGKVSSHHQMHPDRGRETSKVAAVLCGAAARKLYAVLWVGWMTRVYTPLPFDIAVGNNSIKHAGKMDQWTSLGPCALISYGGSIVGCE